MTNQKLIRDVLGSPIPQHLDEGSGFYVVNTNGTGDATGVDFSKKKLLRDALGSVIPQYYDVVEGKFKPVTSEGGNSNDGNGSDTRIGDMSQLQTQQKDTLVNSINEVFTQVSNGKSLLETAIIEKGSTVEKVGEIATYEELKDGINNIIDGGSAIITPYPAHSSLTKGKEYVVLERGGKGYLLIVFIDFLQGLYTQAGTGGYPHMLKAYNSVTYDVYSEIDGTWIKSNHYKDNIGYSMFAVEENTSIIYLGDLTTVTKHITTIK